MSKVNIHNLNEEYLNSMSEEERLKEIQSWTSEELVRHLCPDGVISLEEFRRYAHEIAED